MCTEIGGQATTDGVHVFRVCACVETAGLRRANLVSVTSSRPLKSPLDVENMCPGVSRHDASNHPKALRCRAPPPPQKLPTRPYVEQKTHLYVICLCCHLCPVRAYRRFLTLNLAAPPT